MGKLMDSETDLVKATGWGMDSELALVTVVANGFRPGVLGEIQMVKAQLFVGGKRGHWKGWRRDSPTRRSPLLWVYRRARWRFTGQI